MTDKAPERIWAGKTSGIGGWHEGKDFVNNVEYVRADLHAALSARIDEQLKAADKLAEAAAHMMYDACWGDGPSIHAVAVSLAAYSKAKETK